jgi:hypothetical protein
MAIIYDLILKKVIDIDSDVQQLYQQKVQKMCEVLAE